MLDELRERGLLAGRIIVDVLGEDGNRLSVGLTLELVPTLLEDKTKSSRVGDDAVMDDTELRGRIGLQRVAVDDGRGTVGGPARVRDRDLRNESLRSVDVGLGDALAESGDLADLLEEEHLSGLVAIDANTRGVVATVLLAGEARTEDLTDRLAVLSARTRLGNADNKRTPRRHPSPKAHYNRPC